MRVETKTEFKEVTTTIYIANDGTRFNSESECSYHDLTYDLTVVYGLYLRGGRTDNIELYSTLELAEKHKTDKHTIKKIFVDYRDKLTNYVGEE